MDTMRTITGMGITLRMPTDLITRVVRVTGTVPGITHICTIGIVGPFTAAAIGAAMATPIKDRCSADLNPDVLSFGRLKPGGPNAVSYLDALANHIMPVIHVYDAVGNVLVIFLLFQISSVLEKPSYEKTQ